LKEFEKLLLDNALLKVQTKHWLIKTYNGSNGGKPYRTLRKNNIQGSLEITCVDEEAYLNELVAY
jgi:hypothetical protein